MKRPQPDLGVATLNSFINTVGHVRKLKRLWGTTSINVAGESIDVLTLRQYYHPVAARMGYNPVDPQNATSEEKTPKKFLKLINFLDIYNETVESSKKGLKSAWLYFNKNKVKNSLLDPNSFVAGNLNKVFWDSTDPVPENLTLTTTIVIDALINSKFTTFFLPEGEITRELPTTKLLNTSMTEAEMIAAIAELNYETLWDTCVIWQEGVGVIKKGESTDPNTLITTPEEDYLSPEDPWLNLISRYALRDKGIPCTIKKVEVGLREAFDDYTGSKSFEHVNGGLGAEGVTQVNKGLYNSYIVTLEIPYMTFGNQSLFVSEIAADLDAEYPKPSKYFLKNSNPYYSQSAAQKLKSLDVDNYLEALLGSFEDPEDIILSRSYTLWEDATVSSDPRFNTFWVKHNDNWYLKADVFTRPSDYDLKFKELAEYVFSIIDVGYKKKNTSTLKKIVAFVVFVVAIVVFRGAGIGWAKAILFSSLVLTGLTLVFSMLGMDSWAAAFAEANRTLEPLVMIATLYLFVNNIAKNIAASAVTPEAVIDAAGNYITDLAENMVTEIIQGATDVFAGNFMTDAGLKFLGVVAKLGMMPAQLKLESLNDRNKDLKAEYQELIQEISREYDVLKGFARIYAMPATADWSMYSELFDLPYERGGGTLALGNIQRTTKQAIRKGDYSDPIFDNILVV